MSNDEYEFWNDVRSAVSDYDCCCSHYHENQYGDRYFTVEVEIDEDEWGCCGDEIWDCLQEVADDWDAGIDDDGNIYSLSLNVTDD